MDANTLSTLGIVVSLVFIITLALRGWHIIVLAPLAAIIAALFSNLNVLETLTGPYMTGFTNYARRFYLIFLMGTLFGKFMEDSGAARSIAQAILRLIGGSAETPLRVLVAFALVPMALTYGGVSLFVVIFTVLPIARHLWQEADIPWHLFMLSFVFGAASMTMTMLPGTPQIQNLMPTKYMSSTPASAPVLGLLGAFVVFAINVLYMRYCVRKFKREGEHYVPPAGAAGPAAPERGTPHAGLSLLPMAAVLIFLNVPAVKVDVIYALGIGILVTMLLFWRFIPNVVDTITRGAANTVVPIVNTCADVGYGMAIAATAGFRVVSAWLLTLPMHPIVSLSIATNIMAAITGSASGGMGIVLETLAPKYLALGLSPHLVHRIVVMSAGCFDAMPHNGAVITMLAVAGLTHRQAYKHIFVGHVLATLVALIVVIPLGILLY
ncbi:MAG TPA: GntP family permease [Thermoanaerobaculia bacterium]|nr:GntP family permease [Thermoanaerobaculia bacterium]